MSSLTRTSSPGVHRWSVWPALILFACTSSPPPVEVEKGTTQGDVEATSTRFTVGAVTSPPAIDGVDDASWSSSARMPIARTVVGTVSSAADASGRFSLLWDDTNLYALFVVTDDAATSDSATQLFNDDAVELDLDLNHDRGTTYGADDFHFLFRRGDTTVQEVAHQATSGVRVATTQTATGYVIELAIPWATLGKVPQANMTIGVEGIVDDDDDGGGRDAQLAWASSDAFAFRSPDRFGHATLKPEPLVQLTVESMCGGGNIYRTDSTSPKLTDLRNLHCASARVALYPENDYFSHGAASPSTIDALVLTMLRAGIEPYVHFEFQPTYNSANLGVPERNYQDWRSIGEAFATRFSPGSAFLASNNLSGRGIVRWAAINEVDRMAGEDPGLTRAQFHAMLQGLADGIHTINPTAKVFPGGFLGPGSYGPTRPAEAYKAFGYLSGVADLINNGTLAGFDLHAYPDKLYERLWDRYTRSLQYDFERCIADSGITRVDLEWNVTEYNVKADPDATKQGYDEPTARRWFLTSFFDAHGLRRADGSGAPGVRLAWNIWRQGPEMDFMAETLVPWTPRWTGKTYQLVLRLVHDMGFVSRDPKGTGTFKLVGGGKTAWVFQNIHPTWSTLYGTTFNVTGIPAGATKLEVYDGVGLIRTIPLLTGQNSCPVDTPTGRSYLILANAQ